VHLLSLESTNLDRVGYDPGSQELLVIFQDRSSYRYFGVPAVVFENLRTAPSKGAYFNYAIRGAYTFLPARCED
jgi:hypothetical protein